MSAAKRERSKSTDLCEQCGLIGPFGSLLFLPPSKFTSIFLLAKNIVDVIFTAVDYHPPNNLVRHLLQPFLLGDSKVIEDRAALELLSGGGGPRHLRCWNMRWG